MTNENLPYLNKDQKGFLLVNAEDEALTELNQYTQLVLVVQTKFANKTQLFRKFRLNYAKKGLKNPVIMRTHSNDKEAETFQLSVSADMGATFIDGFGDGIWISAEQPLQLINSTSFGILQATRTRISKTEYISCPSCGRTLFDLQETTAKIREKTSHLKGIKIG
ncbi:MAG: flavodoxin-dependent (E)-4-hydroxy-3-methylbut-2-enyl-diphosphate synthase, partial [Crocinitomicaceae bacterium]